MLMISTCGQWMETFVFVSSCWRPVLIMSSWNRFRQWGKGGGQYITTCINLPAPMVGIWHNCYPGPLTTLAPWWLPLNRDHHPIISFAGVGDSTLIDGGLTKRPVLLPARAYLSVIYGQVVIHVTQKYRKKSLKAIEKIIFLVCHLLN